MGRKKRGIPGPAARSSRRLRPPKHAREIAGAFLLIALVLVAFAPALRAGFVWDDDIAVTDNPVLRESTGWLTFWTHPERIPQRHYWPLVYTAFWLDYKVWGLNPFGYHLINILLHAFNSVILWVVLRRAAIPAAWLAAAIFAVHPMHVESVAWIVERKDVLSGALYLLAAWAFLRFRGGGRTAWYFLSLVFFAGALLSKTMVVSFPLALWVWIWWKEGRVGRRDLLTVVPFVGLAALAAVFDVTVSRIEVPPSGLSVLERLLAASRVVWFYAGKMIWPSRLMAQYPKWVIDPSSIVQWLYPMALLALSAAFLLLRRRIGRGVPAACAFFVISLGPVLGLVDHGFIKFSFVADHFVYLPSIGLIVLGAAGMEALSRRLHMGSRPAAAAGALLLGVLGVLTWQNSLRFHDSERLFRDNLDKNPAAFAAHLNLGLLLAARGESDEAIRHFRESIRLEPTHVDAYNGLGPLLAMRGDLDEAVLTLQRAVTLKPDFADAHYNLGTTLLLRGDAAQAVLQFRRAVELQPRDTRARLTLAQALLLCGRPDEALVEFDRLDRATPGNPEVQMGYAEALAKLGRTDEAAARYREAKRLTSVTEKQAQERGREAAKKKP